MEEETLKRKRLRVLVLLPSSFSCPESIKVITGNSSCLISSREVQSAVDLGGISKILGLDKVVYGTTCVSENGIENVKR